MRHYNSNEPIALNRAAAVDQKEDPDWFLIHQTLANFPEAFAAVHKACEAKLKAQAEQAGCSRCRGKKVVAA